jgi:hypothetical protein
VHDGAQYDVVQTVGFTQLKQMSLLEVFMLVLENNAVSRGGIDSEIERLKEQIEEQRHQAEMKEGKKSPVRK